MSFLRRQESKKKNFMARRNYLVEGGQLQCTLGTAPGEMVVTSQQKLSIKKKLKATSEDKTFKPPFFGSCKCSSPNPPCAPTLQEWQLTSKKSKMGTKTFVMSNSKILCTKGGEITVKDVGQQLVGTGTETPELDKNYAKLQGEIVFANGYLSSSLGGALNAVKDINPDEPSSDLRRGWNADENDKINGQDILLASQVQENKALTDAEKKIEADAKKLKIKFRYPIFMMPPIPRLPSIPVTVKVIKPIDLKDVPEMTLQERVDTFHGYWNEVGTLGKGSSTYADHFNAGSNQHFLNGSHGLASNGAHRMDHGLAQGYHWAKYQWGIIPKEEVDDTKEKVPYIKSYSPAYKPLTIVMHSQGNAPGAGFALGVMKYANELGWEQMPLNLIFLGVHQPQNLWEEDYTKFIKAKTKHYVADTNFWDTISTFEKTLFLVGNKYVKGGVILEQYLSNKEDRDILKYLNGIAELFSPKYHKLRHKRGIYEHLQAISNFDALKERSVQFTFSNDRADIVCRDGDLPNVDCACNPKIDTSLYSVEFFPKGVEVPGHYKSNQGKEIIAIENGGSLVIPAYAVIQRLKAFKDEKMKDNVRIEHDWASYRNIAIDWGNAMSTYRKQKKQYERLTKQKLSFLDVIVPVRLVARKSAEMYTKLRIGYWFRKVVYHYARIQLADLYAHFSPVEFINNKKILKISTDFKDSLGNDTIWERIKKTGENKFYRVEYDKDPSVAETMSLKAKRIKEKKEIEGKLNGRQIDTGIADNTYIQNVIKAFVHGDKNGERQLYHEPLLSDKEQAAYDEFMKKLGDIMPEVLKKATEPHSPSDKEIETIQEYIQKL